MDFAIPTDSSNESSPAPGLRAFAIVMIVASTIAVAVRVWSRIVLSRTSNQQWGWDDYLALLSWPFVIGLPILGLVWLAKGGLAQHLILLPLDEISEGLKIYWACQIIYAFAICLPKFSVLCFYNRVLKITTSPVWPFFWLAIFLVSGWLVSTIFVICFQCTPLEKVWLPWHPGTCIDTFSWFLGDAIANVVIDLLILWLPVPILWKLRLSRGKKLQLIGFFICGYGVLVISIGRLATNATLWGSLQTDPTWNAVPLDYWLTSEGCILLISICLPNMFSLIQRARHHGVKALFTRRILHIDTQARSKGRGVTNGSLETRSFAHKTTSKDTINDKSQVDVEEAGPVRQPWEGAI